MRIPAALAYLALSNTIVTGCVVHFSCSGHDCVFVVQESDHPEYIVGKAYRVLVTEVLIDVDSHWS